MFTIVRDVGNGVCMMCVYANHFVWIFMQCPQLIQRMYAVLDFIRKSIYIVINYIIYIYMTSYFMQILMFSSLIGPHSHAMVFQSNLLVRNIHAIDM